MLKMMWRASLGFARPREEAQIASGGFHRRAVGLHLSKTSQKLSFTHSHVCILCCLFALSFVQLSLPPSLPLSVAPALLLSPCLLLLLLPLLLPLLLLRHLHLHEKIRLLLSRLGGSLPCASVNWRNDWCRPPSFFWSLFLSLSSFFLSSSSSSRHGKRAYPAPEGPHHILVLKVNDVGGNRTTWLNLYSLIILTLGDWLRDNSKGALGHSL